MQGAAVKPRSTPKATERLGGLPWTRPSMHTKKLRDLELKG